MRRPLFPNVAALAVTIAGSAMAADLSVKAPAPFPERFNWTSCYVGGHIGGGFGRRTSPTPCGSYRIHFWALALRPVSPP